MLYRWWLETGVFWDVTPGSTTYIWEPKGSMWSCGYASCCWRMLTNKTPEMSRIPTRCYACMSTPWSLGNAYVAISWRLQMGTCQLGKKPLAEKLQSSRIASGGHRIEPNPKNDLSRNAKKESQGSHRAVEPIIIITIIVIVSVPFSPQANYTDWATAAI
jgi:hypothetical protein